MYIPTFILFIQESVCTVIKCYECRHLYLPIVLSGGIQGLRIDRSTKITTGHQAVILFHATKGRGKYNATTMFLTIAVTGQLPAAKLEVEMPYDPS